MQIYLVLILSIFFKKDDDVKNLEATDGNKLVRLSEREGRDLLNDDLDVVELTINEVQSNKHNHYLQFAN